MSVELGTLEEWVVGKKVDRLSAELAGDGLKLYGLSVAVIDKTVDELDSYFGSWRLGSSVDAVQAESIAVAVSEQALGAAGSSAELHM
jgi:hypothetical protein